jgi:GNAT superfamily N-acetyltransferase
MEHPRDPAALPDALAMLGAIHRAAVRAEWAAAQAAGIEVSVVEAGGLLFGAAPTVASTMFNRALGVADQPERLGEALAFLTVHGVSGDIPLDPADVPAGVEPRARLDAFVAAPGAIEPAVVPGFATRIVGPDETDAWMDLAIEGNERPPGTEVIWRAMVPGIASTPGWILLIGEQDGRACASSSLFLAGDKGWMSWASVLPAARGHGIQRAMIAARAAVAMERGCSSVAAWALEGGHSSTNLARSGFSRIGQRAIVRSDVLG